MKHVVFLDENSGSAAMAAALFRSMIHPELVRGDWACPPGGARVPQEVKRALAEVGFLSSLSEPVGPEILARADKQIVISGAGELGKSLSHADEWHFPRLATFDAGIADFRDKLRVRVWRMVALEGWYRLQPRPTKIAALPGRRPAAPGSQGVAAH